MPYWIYIKDEEDEGEEEDEQEEGEGEGEGTAPSSDQPKEQVGQIPARLVNILFNRSLKAYSSHFLI